MAASGYTEVQTANGKRLMTEREKATYLANPPDSPKRVARVNRSEVKGLVAGGSSTFKSLLSPTDFIPQEGKDPSTQMPDFYRNGRMARSAGKIDGENVERLQWEPLQESIGERPTPLLASIRLVDVSDINNQDPNNPTPLQIIPEYSKFFLEAVQESHQEKFQIVETFNDWYAFFYGEKPATYVLSGYLLNLHNYNWYNEFIYFYQNYWRGTKAVEKKARIFLTYNYQQVQGYVLNIQTNIQALTDKAAPFSITVLVTKRLIFNGTADDGIIRDNYLPRSDTGLINTNADAVAVKLTAEYLEGKKPASEDQEIDDSNRDSAQRTAEKSADSAVKQKPMSMNRVDGQTGYQNASSLKGGLSVLA